MSRHIRVLGGHCQGMWLLLVGCGPDHDLLDIHLRLHVESAEGETLNARGVARTDWLTDTGGYDARLRSFLAWEAEVYARGAQLDFMAEGDFWRATVERADTWPLHGDENLARWLLARGHGVYAHTHGNYADTTWALAEALGEPPAPVVGGFMLEDYNLFLAPIEGKATDSSATYEILTGAGSTGHDGDDHHCGIWRPRSGEEFALHDPDGPLVYVGSGPETTLTVEALASDSRQWTTAAIMVDYEDLSGSDDTPPAELIVAMDNIAAAGPVRFVNVEASVAEWKAQGEGDTSWDCK